MATFLEHGQGARPMRWRRGCKGLPQGASAWGVGGEKCPRSPPQGPVLAVEAELRAGKGLRVLGMERTHSGRWLCLGRVCRVCASEPGEAHVEVGRLG